MWQALTSLWFQGPGWLVLAGLLGLIVGSFLNVVVHRLPLMLERQWQADSRAYLNLPEPEPAQSRYNLSVPRSACPHCGHVIRAWENIPILSFLCLRGRCSGCHAAISWRYPMVEAAGALLALAAAYTFGASIQTVFLWFFLWALLALALIDWDTQLLPDDITLPLLWLGLIYQMVCHPHMLSTAVIGAIMGYMILWSVYWGFKLTTGREGMGYGDFKLLAALGAWLGWLQLPFILLIAAVAGLILAGAAMLFFPSRRGQPFAFGPYLVLAGILTLFWGQTWLNSYLHS